MKTRARKEEDVKMGRELLSKSQLLLFAELDKLPAEDVRRLRRDLSQAGATLYLLRKRLLNLILKEKGIEYDSRQFKLSVGTVFAGGEIDKVSGPLVKFFKELKLEKEKVLGGYDLAAKEPVTREKVLLIGQLPPRDVLLAQLLGLISAPVRSFLYLLGQKAAPGKSQG